MTDATSKDRPRLCNERFGRGANPASGGFGAASAIFECLLTNGTLTGAPTRVADRPKACL